MGRSTKDYKLEALEPRLLLSGDGLLGALAADMVSEEFTDAYVVEEDEGFFSSEPATASDAEEEPLTNNDAEKEKTSEQPVTEETPTYTIKTELDDETIPVTESNSGTSARAPPESSETILINDEVDANTAEMVEILHAANGPPAEDAASYPWLPGLQLIDLDVSSFRGQVFYLDFDGENNVTYDGPVRIDGLDISPFSTPNYLGDESTIISTVIRDLNGIFEDSGITFTDRKPVDGTAFSTIYVDWWEDDLEMK